MRKSSTARLMMLAAAVLALVCALTLLPAAAQEDTTYVIQYGDTLSQIAMEFDAQIECIADANGILVNLIIFPDTVLTIPGDCPPYGAPVVFPPAIQPAPGDFTVVMQPRDVVLLIAEELNVSAEAILAYNRIVNAFALRAGTTLVIWGDAPPFGTVPPLRIYNTDTGEWVLLLLGQDIPLAELEVGYVVQARENLDLIAVAFDVAVSCLQERNGLVEDVRIYAGDVIVIPNGCEPYDGLSSLIPLRGYVVGEGDDGDEGAPPLSDISEEGGALQEAFASGTPIPTSAATDPVQMATQPATTAPLLPASTIQAPIVIPTNTTAPVDAGPTATNTIPPTRRPTVTPTLSGPTPTVETLGDRGGEPSTTQEAAG